MTKISKTTSLTGFKQVNPRALRPGVQQNCTGRNQRVLEERKTILFHKVRVEQEQEKIGTLLSKNIVREQVNHKEIFGSKLTIYSRNDDSTIIKVRKVTCLDYIMCACVYISLSTYVHMCKLNTYLVFRIYTHSDYVVPKYNDWY